MHNIERCQEPSILKKNKEKWTSDLLKEIDEKGGFKNVDDSFKKHYKHDEVTHSLIKMNGDSICFYCEQKIGKTDYAHIEHFKPKSQFPELTFEWENLHLSCQKCNLKKGIKWDFENPILDPCCSETDINSHIYYSLWDLIPETENAITTIDTFHLNDKIERNELIQARIKVFTELMRIIENVNRSKDNIQKRRNIDVLKRYASDYEFKRLIDDNIRVFLKD